MMRSIRFRAWDKENKIMYSVDEIRLNNSDGNAHIFIKGRGWLSAGKGILMQFTDLLDKNGKEIWEGDIVTYIIYEDKEDNPNFQPYQFKGVVKFEDGEFHPRPYRYECEDYWYSFEVKDFEVIGNIYSNPELLKG